MKVTLINGTITRNFILPVEITGNFWLTDSDEDGNNRNLINIEADEGKWRLKSNDEVYCIVNGKRALSIILNEFSFCVIKNTYTNQYLIIYCAPLVEGTLTYYECLDNTLATGITIGRNQKNHIVYNLSPLEECHAVILYDKNKNVIVKDRDKGLNEKGNKYGTYINGKRITEPTILNNGDVIFILGLKVVFINRNDKKYIVLNNPNNMIRVNGLYKTESFDTKEILYEKEDEDLKFSLYEEKDYYYRNPRFIYEIKEYEINIDRPPEKVESDKPPAILTVGPMITMSLSSVVTSFASISNSTASGRSVISTLPTIVMCVAMLAGTIMWPSITRKYEEKQEKEKEEERQQKYSRYIDELKTKIFNEINNQQVILKNANPTLDECYKIIVNKYTNFWERRTSDSDFLKISLGIGTIPMSININYSEDTFTLVEDNLKQLAEDLYKSEKKLVNVPVTFSFKEKKVSGIVGSETVTDRFIKNILLQLFAFHCYDSLKVVVFTSSENSTKWDYLKTTPYCWNDDKKIRFFSTDNEDTKEICYYLNKIYNDNKENNKNSDTKTFNQEYLIITDSFKTIRNFDFIKEVLNNSEYYGFSISIISKRITDLPDACKDFIRLNNNTGEVFNNIENNYKQQFNIDTTTEYNIKKAAKILSNTPIELNNLEEGKLPDKMSFLEMYDVGKIEQLNISNRWNNNTPILNMSVPVGNGKNGETINLDLHEKYHGPHGLIAGMTGSGKSEFIITYILSLAVNYHPNEVQFIIIDYKGGGLAGAFKNETTGIVLPHLVGTITNLDMNELNRSFASIESELKRRQRLFNEAREITKEGTIDIYKYQKLYRNKTVKEPISHLFIVCDEFAELKQQQPDFMEQLVSTARIGRSLGVHLILATQKPSGVVDPQIWSNTRFRICMRVQETSDSDEVIKCPDAAFLTKTGRFYMQVGYNEIFTLGQAAWAGAKYYATEKIKKEVDTTIDFLNNVGYSIKNVETKSKQQENIVAKGEELTNILSYIYELAKKEQISVRQLWKEKMPKEILVDDLIKKYEYKAKKFNLNPIIGEYDVPNEQEQYLLTIPITEEGNVLIYGSSGSGKENLITTMIYTSSMFYTPEEVNYYIIDCGTEVLKYFNNSPYVGNVISAVDQERITNLFKFLNENIAKRKQLLSAYNGDFLLYNEKESEKLANIVVIINNYDTFNELYMELEDNLISLTRECVKCGIYILITTSNPSGIRYKLRQNFAESISLQLNDEDDYSYVFGKNIKITPMETYGRGVIIRKDINEFQTALVTKYEDIPQYIFEYNKKQSIEHKYHAPKVRILPEIVTYEDVIEEYNNSKEIIIGIQKSTLSISKVNYVKDMISIFSSIDNESLATMVTTTIQQLQGYKDLNVVVFNSTENMLTSDIDNSTYYTDDFDEPLLKLKNEIMNLTNNKTSEDNRNVYIFYGLDDIKTKVKEENANIFNEIMESLKNNNKYSFLFFDSMDQIKKYDTQSWFKNFTNLNNAVWVGDGLDDQYTIKITKRTQEMRELLEEGYCFVITKGRPVLVKSLSTFDQVEKI